MTIIWCMVPEIPSVTDRISCPFWTIFCHATLLTTRKIKIFIKWKNTLRYYHFTHMYHKWESYDVWFMKYGAWQTQFFVILDHFLHFYHPSPPPLTTQKFKNFKKWKNTWRHYHFIHVYHKWQSYDVWFLWYGVWWTECFVVSDSFLPFYPPNQKNQKFRKNEKYTWRYYHFKQVYNKWKSHDVWFLRYEAWTLDHFLPFYTFLQKSKFWKAEKKVCRYHHFTQVYQKSWSYPILLLRYGT